VCLAGTNPTQDSSEIQLNIDEDEKQKEKNWLHIRFSAAC
jgi:hypothetical protein